MNIDAPIYLDHNATTPVLPEVVDAMLPFLREHFGNPSSGHIYGRRARSAVERARSQVASLLGCGSDEILFTSGGTEANNLAIRGATSKSPRRRIVTTQVEHPATARPVCWLGQQGWEVIAIGVDVTGRARSEELENAVTDATALISLMHSNNETGTLQPVQAAIDAARRVGALVHTDAAQSVGKIAINLRQLGVDLLSIAGHKLYAPKGVGALFVRRGTTTEPVVLGADHEYGLRPGTENVASIVGLGEACALAQRDMERESVSVGVLRDQLWALLVGGISGLELNGHPNERLPNTLNIRVPFVSGTALLAATPQVAASTGSACHAGTESASVVLRAMGLSANEALGSIRLSLGRATTAKAVEQAAAVLIRNWKAMTNSPPAQTRINGN